MELVEGETLGSSPSRSVAGAVNDLGAHVLIEIVSDLKAHQRLQVLPGSQRLCSLIRASQGIPKTRPLSLTPSTLL